mmetsp:Transcript_435/g.1304  ORF Transcript_435/g.1304 Transcript_435/m.1304 type:complete len:210 (-) Transcript_435:841-1470(-)
MTRRIRTYLPKSNTTRARFEVLLCLTITPRSLMRMLTRMLTRIVMTMLLLPHRASVTATKTIWSWIMKEIHLSPWKQFVTKILVVVVLKMTMKILPVIGRLLPTKPGRLGASLRGLPRGEIVPIRQSQLLHRSGRRSHWEKGRLMTMKMLPRKTTAAASEEKNFLPSLDLVPLLRNRGLVASIPSSASIKDLQGLQQRRSRTKSSSGKV